MISTPSTSIEKAEIYRRQWRFLWFLNQRRRGRAHLGGTKPHKGAYQKEQIDLNQASSNQGSLTGQAIEKQQKADMFRILQQHLSEGRKTAKELE